MSKPKRMKKRIGLEAVVFGGIAAALAGGMIGTGSWFKSVDTKRMSLQSEVSNSESRIADITRQIDESGTSSEVFNKIRGQKDNLEFNFERDQARDRLAVLREKFRLSSLALVVSPEITLNLPKLQNMNTGAVYTDIELKFGAMSDTHIFSFIEELQRSMPGFVRVDKIELEREKAMDVTIFRLMSRGAVPQMVSGTIVFKWIGLAKPKPVEDGTQAAPDGGMMP